MTTESKFLIYGATGYTGKLVVHMAVKDGLKPLLSGRNSKMLKQLAEPLGLEYEAVFLDNQDALERLLEKVDIVLHIAGPFSATARPMVQACLNTQTHYLDITGEIPIFEKHFRLDDQAREKDIMIMSGVGFDVVPTDCLSAHLKKRMPDATELTLSLAGSGGLSPGTAKTVVEGIGYGTAVRREGNIVEIEGALHGKADFGRGERETIAIGWGDVSTAFHTTGIPNITVFFKSTSALKFVAGMGKRMKGILGKQWIQRILKNRIERLVKGPDDEARSKGYCIIVGEVKNKKGSVMKSRLLTPEGYTLTCLCALEILRQVQQGNFRAGFGTPAGVYGADFILQFEGVEREDL
ncbi:MAG: saccharopine dehydrogenase NADP-binding domain-containing protein [Flavobacteriales bacterium]|nr:saccharopine dehydrogenase NADP-binding domain-containing protein [Flavobacteriales bacterium]